jgi:uncharacterized protein (TIGR02453 family)
MDFEQILTFLSKLSRNNNRPWFEKNKSEYLKAKAGFEDFLEELLPHLAKLDEGLAGLNARKLAFRIYRDVRFSKDKKPYKINMGAGFSPGGKLIQEPGYYIHVQPGGKSFLAGGLYMPDPPNLSKIRQEIDYSPEVLPAILNDKKFKNLFPRLDDFDALKTTPKGYVKDHPSIDLLRHRSFIVSHPLTDRDVKNKKFVKIVAETARVLRPLNDFLKEAIA